MIRVACLGLLVALGGVPLAAWAGDPDGLVRVESTYEQDETGLPFTIQGTGIVVKWGKELNRLGVLTAAHVSQGKELKMTSGRKTLQPLAHRRWADRMNDVELIEIAADAKIPVFAVWSGNDFPQVYPGYFTIVDSGLWRKLDRMIPDRLMSEAQEGEVALDKGWLRLNHQVYVPVASWVKQKPFPFTTRQTFIGSGSHMGPGENARHGNGFQTDDFLGWESDSRIVPGMSGSPVLAKRDVPMLHRYGFAVVGLTRAYHRYFDRSYFSANYTIQNVVEFALTHPDGGNLDESLWRVKNGVTYIQVKNGCEEIIPTRPPSGGGTKADGGGGTKADGGDDLRAGKPVTLPPPGMLWESQPTIGFWLQTEKMENAVPIYAELDAVRTRDRLAERQKITRFDPIPIGADLLNPVLDSVLGFRNEAPEKYYEIGCHFDAKKARDGILELKIGVRIDRLRHQPLNAKTYDTLQVTLRANGSPLEEAEPGTYQPILKRIGDVSQAVYYVDVGGMFFVNPSKQMRWLTLGYGRETQYLLIVDQEPHVVIRALGEFEKEYRDTALRCFWH
ncbi:MAG: hypothetical protein AB7P04_02760 [Bacteriovoracia bacterium]